MFRETIPTNWMHYPELRALNHEVFNILYSWATLPQTLDQVRAIERQTCRCSKSSLLNSNAYAHELDRENREEPIRQRQAPTLRLVSSIVNTTLIPFQPIWEGGTSKLERLLKKIGKRT